MNVHQSIALLAAESAAREGPTPQTLPGALREVPTFAIARDAFLLRLPSGLTFHYRQGDGVTWSRPDSVSDLEISLFLNGSVYGAIAWINGFVPLHASGVVFDGKVHAFTGHSGAGKSTLAAALSDNGLPLLADDVLVLDLTDPEALMCLPGHKQLKLWGDALGLTGLRAEHRVRDNLEKFYATPSGGFHSEPLPLARLFLLGNNSRSAPVFSPVSGASRLSLLRTALYRPRFCAALIEGPGLFALLSRIAAAITMTRFDRPHRKELFAEGVSAMAATIRGHAP